MNTTSENVLRQSRSGLRNVLLVAMSLCGCVGFLDTAAKEPGAVRLSSGMVYKTLTPASDPAAKSPKPTDMVRVHYHGTLTDGSVFDSSVERGQPAEFSLERVVRCFSEGLSRMKVGEKARLTCPSELAYGDAGKPPTVPGGATLIFDVELLSIL